MIEISHLTKKYGTHVAVDDLNLTIEPGRIYGFLGPNGAGKSTTMNMITGYLGATEGTIKINGFDILAQPEDGVTEVTVTAEKNKDVREEIFHICAESDMPILEMINGGKSLEDIFLELTSKEEE